MSEIQEGESGPSSALRRPSPRERGDGNTVAIVGAGIVGICAATNLAEAGYAVTVYDRSGICEETSSGNAAALAFPDPLPLAHKGMLKKLPGWMMDPLGPLSIPPAYLPKLAPWLIRFLRAGDPRKFDASLTAQAAMMRLAESEWAGLAERAGAAGMVSHEGAIDLYEGEAEFKTSLPGWAARDRFGIPYEHVSGARLAELQPGLSPRFTHGTFMPSWKTVADPKLFGKAIWTYAETLGAKFEKRTVADTRTVPGERGAEIEFAFADGTKVRAGTLVVCAGAWSHLHAARFGDRIPLETERGYNTTLPVGAFDLKRQITFAGHGFVVSPLVTGVRIGGAVELADLKRPPNYARSKAMLEKAKLFLPGLKAEGGREWMGYRPSLPDLLPVIGRARQARNVVYAFGHGHLGLTQSAAAGRLVRDLICEKTSPIDLAPFSPQRF